MDGHIKTYLKHTPTLRLCLSSSRTRAAVAAPTTGAPSTITGASSDRTCPASAISPTDLPRHRNPQSRYRELADLSHLQSGALPRAHQPRAPPVRRATAAAATSAQGAGSPDPRMRPRRSPLEPRTNQPACRRAMSRRPWGR